MARLIYLEVPARNIAATKEFYARAFDWSFTDFGPDYAATMTGDTDVGLNGDAEDETAHLLPVFDVDDLDATLLAVAAAGGRLTRPIFAFPGGRRFHFTDPEGHELAAMQSDG